MKIHNAWREGFRSFFELGLIILSALFLSNLALGPLELKIVLTLLALGLFFVGRLLDVDFTLLVVAAGVFATAFGMILGDWRRFVVDFFWLTVVGDFAVNKGYFFAFFVGFFFFLFVFIILKMQKIDQKNIHDEGARPAQGHQGPRSAPRRSPRQRR